MASIGAGYDLSATTYSPEGRVFQVEYAEKACESTGTIIGIKAKDGIVIAVEKPITSKLLKPNVNRRSFNVDLHAGMVGTGLVADARSLADIARQEAFKHRQHFDADISGPALAERISAYLQAYTLYSAARPFGTVSILGVVDRDGPHLYMLEPSGNFWGYRACAAGKGRQLAKSELEKLDFENLTTIQAVKEAARVIYMAHDQAKDKEFELDMTWIGPETGNKHQLVPRDLLDAAINEAKQFLLSQMEFA